MATPTNVLDGARSLLEERIAQLDDEKKRLERAIAELSGSSSSAGRRGPGRPRGSTNRSSGGGGSTRRRRRRKGGTRADQAVKLIESNPGISASEIAREMDIKPNYLYRVLGDLEKEGRLEKDGRTYAVPGASSGSSNSSRQGSSPSSSAGNGSDDATVPGTEGGGKSGGPSGAGFESS